MNDIKIFNHTEFGKIRTMLINNEPWFVAKDVCEALGYRNASKAIADHVDSDEKLNNESLLSLGQRGGWLIKESGVYSLVFSSKLPSAKEFRRWVTSDVLPSIRKHGGYLTPSKIEDALSDPDTIIKLATVLKEERVKRMEAETKIEEAKPKILFADAVSSSTSTILIGDLAKLLKQNGLDIGQKRLFKWLRNNGYLIKRTGSDYNSPTQRSMEMGLFKIKETAITHADGHVIVSKTVKVTGKGQQYFIEKFLGGGFAYAK